MPLLTLRRMLAEDRLRHSNYAETRSPIIEPGDGFWIQRISQRTKDDCAICTIAMVMDQPYTYERVLRDSVTFPITAAGGKFLAWSETYLLREGFETAYRPFADLYRLPGANRNVRGILGIDPRLSRGLRRAAQVSVDQFREAR